MIRNPMYMATLDLVLAKLCPILLFIHVTVFSRGLDLLEYKSYCSLQNVFAMVFCQ